jgi:N6-L-threonylcarbamoyladenine synthase
VLEEALAEAKVTIDDIDLIGVAYGPGLVGSLLIGVATAKAISFAKDIPLVGVNHMHGHIAANYIEFKDLKPPFLGLIVSGGHTNIVMVNDYDSCEVLGSTRDDAIGEAYDKVARVIGLGYPGGPKIDELAKKGNKKAINFKRVYLEKGCLDFSFSGTKTGVLNHVNRAKQKGDEIYTADIAASFQEAVLEVIVDKAIGAAKKLHQDTLVVAGGVAANSRLNDMLNERCKEEGIKLYKPSPILCTDNGAMIGCAAYYKMKKGEISDLSLDAYPGLEI